MKNCEIVPIVIYSKSEEAKAFVHANCGRCSSSERKRPYSRVLCLILSDTSSEIESVSLYWKYNFWTYLLQWKKKQNKQSSVTSIKWLYCGNGWWRVICSWWCPGRAKCRDVPNLPKKLKLSERIEKPCEWMKISEWKTVSEKR
jgi:hypothetical protein